MIHNHRFATCNIRLHRYMLLANQNIKHQEFLIFCPHDPTTIILLIKIGTWGIPRIPGIWKIPQILRYLRNSPNSLIFRIFPCRLGIWEISWKWKYNTLRFFKEVGVFPRFQGIWGISQNPEYLGNFPNFQAFRELPKFPKLL